MGEVVHNKLVRDKIPEIIEAEGKTPYSHVLSDDEYRDALRAKLVEEAGEVMESNGDLSEYADTLEVFKAAIEADGYTWEQVEGVRVQKREDRGGFENRIFLERVDERTN